jgi:hypothetical protein
VLEFFNTLLRSSSYMTLHRASGSVLAVVGAALVSLASASCFDFDGAFANSGAGGAGGVSQSIGSTAESTSSNSNTIATSGITSSANASSTVDASSSSGTTCTCKAPGHCEGATCVCPASVVTGERFPASAQGTNGANKGWAGVTSILAYDNNDASVTLDNTESSELLSGHAWNFSDIPADAAISNVLLRIYRCRTVLSSPVSVEDTVVQLLIGGAPNGPNQSGAAWGADCSSPAQYGFDSGSFPLTPAELLGDFGAELRIHNTATGNTVANVDAMTMSVTYVPTCQ